MNYYITLTKLDDYLGHENIKIGQIIKLEKDLNNIYDDEAIKAVSENNYTIGYVANSVCSVARGTHSAGYVHDKINKKTNCIVRFVFDDKAICEIINK